MASPPGQLVMFMTSITVIYQQLSRAAQSVAAHQEVIRVARECASWLEMTSDDELPEPARPVRRPHHRPPAVRVEGLRFKYPGKPDFTLNGLDLEIPAGQSLAIVGRNGSGKSTLVKLLCRLYDPDEGTIRYDGVDVRELAIEDVRRSTAVIFQDFVRYQLPVDENIALRLVDDPACVEAVLPCGADGWRRRNDPKICLASIRHCWDVSSWRRTVPSSPAVNGSGSRWRGHSAGMPAC